LAAPTARRDRAPLLHQVAEQLSTTLAHLGDLAGLRHLGHLGEGAQTRQPDVASGGRDLAAGAGERLISTHFF